MMNQVEISKRRLSIENTIQELLKKKKEAEHILDNVTTSLGFENRKLEILLTDPDRYLEMLAFDQKQDDNWNRFLRKGKEIVVRKQKV